MLRTLKSVMRQDREKFKIPRSVQQAIPIQRIWKDGIFQVGRNKFAKTYRFTDINFEVLSEDDKKAKFLNYMSILNFFDCGATAKLTVIIRRLNKEELKEAVFIPMQEDGLDKYRKEVNEMLMEKTVGANGMIRELYVTISVYRKNVEDARNYFLRTGNGLISHFSTLGSKCEELDAQEKLHVLYSFYRAGEESQFHFDLKESARLGHSFKDYICPDTMEFERDHFKVGERYGRVLYLKDYASYIPDNMVSEFADINQDMMISIDLIPIPTDEAVREAQTRLLGVETNITNWQRRQNANQNFSATVPYDMEMQKEESREFLRDLTTRDQRMMVAVVTLMHTAKDKKQLDADTNTILSLARNRMCQMAVLKFQQMDGMNTALPIGVRKIDSMRTLTTESLGSLIPFRTQEVMDKGGIYCGVNAISHNLILVNRGFLLNPSAFILGVPGSGKSMLTKMFVLLIILSTTDDQVLIYDPEGEYEPLVHALGGVSLPICAGSEIHLNAMDMVKGYGDKNPIVDKSQFVLSLYERITDETYVIGPKEKSILDRCVEDVYTKKKPYEVPTFFTLRRILQEQDEPEAQDLALMLELFTDGTLNNFSHPTNIETNNRLISFNTRDMVEDMKNLGQLVITDHMINRVSQNWERGVRTHLFLDEFHTLLQHKYSANFFDSAYRRFRKRNAWTTSLTQNVEYVLESLKARTMLSNSEFVIMLNQSASDREQLAELMHISGDQLKYITNANAGDGLAKIGKALVPFQNQMSKGTEIYKLMSTKPEDFDGTWHNVASTKENGGKTDE